MREKENLDFETFVDMALAIFNRCWLVFVIAIQISFVALLYSTRCIEGRVYHLANLTLATTTTVGTILVACVRP